ncbi:4-hydroxy-tetrahydrodipicolinate reductase [Pedomonas mirosovicensis]|uniref:4-hydroxy-tetrahydrodipicolinate reductase n=1 Tax=Pedomonas mirosovicensis TaxID=2908641 RepID=UPI002166C29D|nr:4-hydroxy-tetrahydrodipicolinate reductase [Pedomonas mirosovicensis]MCH8683894.1 4-hydroxy-tetrahydrodipicolinate reductase [Pedomonas mirosovicensis]
MAVRIGIIGAAGRMGHALAEAALAQDGAVLAGAIERPGHPANGQPILPGSDILIRDDAAAVAAECDVLIDFSAPVALAASLALGKPLVVGTTGLEASHHAAIDAAAKGQAVLQSANMSLGVNLLAALVKQAAARLGDDWDIEILEMHHRHKVDAPSGTALLLGRAAAEGRGVDLEEKSVRVRDGITGARRAGDIGFATLRGGSVPGDHTVMFAAENEVIELSHHAQSRAIFARGAVRAALWLTGQKPGRYSMNDVLDL